MNDNEYLRRKRNLSNRGGSFGNGFVKRPDRTEFRREDDDSSSISFT